MLAKQYQWLSGSAGKLSGDGSAAKGLRPDMGPLGRLHGAPGFKKSGLKPKAPARQNTPVYLAESTHHWGPKSDGAINEINDLQDKHTYTVDETEPTTGIPQAPHRPIDPWSPGARVESSPRTEEGTTGSNKAPKHTFASKIRHLTNKHPDTLQRRETIRCPSVDPQ